MRRRSPLQVRLRGAEAGTSTVYLDRYNGHVLRIDDFSKLPIAYRFHAINQAIHLGTILGLPGKIIASLSSLLLAVSVVTGFMIWWQRVI
jgi:uncharacterized iron-regulated membrane protein